MPKRAQELTAAESMIAARLTVVKTLSEFEAQYRKRLEGEVDSALKAHLQENQEQLVTELRVALEATFENQLEEFKRVESTLLEMLHVSVTDKYLERLRHWRERTASLRHHLRGVRQAAGTSSGEIQQLKNRELVLDVAFTLLAATVPFYYRILQLGQTTDPLLVYVIPTRYFILAPVLVILKLLSRRKRIKVEGELQRLVEAEYQTAMATDEALAVLAKTAPDKKSVSSDEVTRPSPEL